MADTIPRFKMNNGRTVPALGLGTWKSKPGEVKQAVKVAIDIGYRHIDCAYLYQNENEIGEAIQEKIKEGVVKRDDLFITSKLWNTLHEPKNVLPAIKESLNSLKLDYLDLYLIHFPMGFQYSKDDFFPKGSDDKVIYSNVDYVDTWKAMEEVCRAGLAKSIGVSNFNSQQLTRILDSCSIKPTMNQVESHPYLNQKKLIRFCMDREVLVTAYSPLGCPDNPWALPDEPVLLKEPKLLEIAQRLGKTPAQVLIRFQIDRNVVVIPKSVNPKRLEENFRVSDFRLTKEDLETLESFQEKHRFRYVNLHWVKDHPHYPYDLEF